MSCLTCGAKDGAYLINGHVVCSKCMDSIQQVKNVCSPISYALQPGDSGILGEIAVALREFNDDNVYHEHSRAFLSAACFAFGLIAAATLAWLGGWA